MKCEDCFNCVWRETPFARPCGCSLTVDKDIAKNFDENKNTMGVECLGFEFFDWDRKYD
jgi:hypothetical protein